MTPANQIDEDRLPTPSSNSVKTIEEETEPGKYPRESLYDQVLDQASTERRGGEAGAVPLLRGAQPAGGRAAQPARARAAGAPGARAAGAVRPAGTGGADTETISVPKVWGDDDGWSPRAARRAPVQRSGGGAGAVLVGSGQTPTGPGPCGGQPLATRGGAGRGQLASARTLGTGHRPGAAVAWVVAGRPAAVPSPGCRACGRGVVGAVSSAAGDGADAAAGVSGGRAGYVKWSASQRRAHQRSP